MAGIARPSRGLHDAPRIAIACGHTGGHVYPALAVAAAYRARRADATILFVGPEEGPGPRLAPAAGHRWVPIAGAPFFRVSRARSLLAATGLVRAVVAGRRVLRAEGVELVLGLGSYATAGVVLAARTLGLATAIHEANAVAGLANRVLGRVVDGVLLGFREAASDFPAGRSLVTGTPVRAALHDVRAAVPLATAGRPFRLLVTGGSHGSAFLDARVPDLVRRLAARGLAVEVRHQAAAVVPTRAAYADLAAEVVPFFDDIGAAYAWADFGITCAGAGTLAELATVGLPALVVPLAVAALDHQTANARAFATTTGTWWVRERDWDVAAIATGVASIATGPDARVEAARRLRVVAAPDAAGAVVDACEAIRVARGARRTRPVSARARPNGGAGRRARRQRP